MSATQLLRLRLQSYNIFLNIPNIYNKYRHLCKKNINGDELVVK